MNFYFQIVAHKFRAFAQSTFLITDSPTPPPPPRIWKELISNSLFCYLGLVRLYDIGCCVALQGESTRIS